MTVLLNPHYKSLLQFLLEANSPALGVFFGNTLVSLVPENGVSKTVILI